MLTFNFHIGDWCKSVMHLTDLERSIYLSLLIRYYDTEQPLPPDEAAVCRIACARNADAMQAVCDVLAEFFTLEEDGYHNKRADQEIAAYHTKSEKASSSARARWSKERRADAERTLSEGNADAMRSQSEGNANHEPHTTNHISTTDVVDKAPSRSQRSSLTVKAMLDTCPGLTEKVAADFLTHRKSVRAALTATAWTAIVKEIQLSGWTPDNALAEAMSAGWRSLKSDWLKNRNAGDQHAARSPAPQRRLSPVERVRIANGMHPDTGEFLDDIPDAIPGTARRVG